MIAFDIDGVIADIIPVIREQFFLNYKFDIKTCENKYWIQIPGIDDKTIKTNIRDILNRRYMTIKPYPNSDKWLRKFQCINNSPILFITAREKFLEYNTKNWINETFPRLEYNIIFCNGNEKGKILKDLNYKYLVEDYNENAIIASEYLDMVFLMNRDWNKNSIINNNIKRVNNLGEVYSILYP